jgi:hypothetical protein
MTSDVPAGKHSVVELRGGSLAPAGVTAAQRPFRSMATQAMADA